MSQVLYLRIPAITASCKLEKLVSRNAYVTISGCHINLIPNLLLALKVPCS